MELKFRSRYGVTGEKKGMTFELPSMTQQQFKDDADINNIIARYEVTGMLVDPLTPVSRTPQFGDFSDMPSYQEAQNVLVAAQNAFMDLPSDIREQFGNDPAKYFDFVQSLKEGTADYQKAIELGMIEPKAAATDGPAVSQPVEN